MKKHKMTIIKVLLTVIVIGAIIFSLYDMGAFDEPLPSPEEIELEIKNK